MVQGVKELARLVYSYFFYITMKLLENKFTNPGIKSCCFGKILLIYTAIGKCIECQESFEVINWSCPFDMSGLTHDIPSSTSYSFLVLTAECWLLESPTFMLFSVLVSWCFFKWNYFKKPLIWYVLFQITGKNFLY